MRRRRGGMRACWRGIMRRQLLQLLDLVVNGGRSKGVWFEITRLAGNKVVATTSLGLP